MLYNLLHACAQCVYLDAVAVRELSSAGPSRSASGSGTGVGRGSTDRDGGGGWGGEGDRSASNSTSSFAYSFNSTDNQPSTSVMSASSLFSTAGYVNSSNGGTNSDSPQRLSSWSTRNAVSTDRNAVDNDRNMEQSPDRGTSYTRESRYVDKLIGGCTYASNQWIWECTYPSMDMLSPPEQIRQIWGDMNMIPILILPLRCATVLQCSTLISVSLINLRVLIPVLST